MAYKPKPNARRVTTCFLRVPAEDWARVRIGEKTEFRTRHREPSTAISVKPPTLVVAYADRGNGHDCRLMVLEEYRYEPLFNISLDPEAVEREGFDSYDEFRRYWRKREKGVYMPGEKVWVWHVRPLEEDDWSMLGSAILDYLYGSFRDSGGLDIEPAQLLA